MAYYNEQLENLLKTYDGKDAGMWTLLRSYVNTARYHKNCDHLVVTELGKDAIASMAFVTADLDKVDVKGIARHMYEYGIYTFVMAHKSSRTLEYMAYFAEEGYSKILGTEKIDDEMTGVILGL